MLTGELPFNQDSEFELKQAQVNEPPPKLPKHLRHFQVVLDRLLAKQPSKRFDDAGKLLRALDFRSQATGEYEAPTSEPAQSAPTSATTRSVEMKLARSRREVIVAVVVAIVTAVALAASIAYQ